jgi:hypothetical protein
MRIVNIIPVLLLIICFDLMVKGKIYLFQMQCKMPLYLHIIIV